METTTAIPAKRPVADTLRAMKVGAVELFPIAQYNTLRASKSNTLVMDVIEGKDWKIFLDRENKVVRVTRIS